MTKGAYFYLLIFYFVCKIKQDDAEQLTTIIVLKCIRNYIANNNLFIFSKYIFWMSL